MAAEYIFAGGNTNVILCERGIRTFEKLIRNNLDISAVPLVKMFSHLPIIIDPSHAAGRRDMVQPLSRAAIAAGADDVTVLKTANACGKLNAMDPKTGHLVMDRWDEIYNSVVVTEL